MERYFKLAKVSGWDFYTGNTINYRDNIGKIVSPPNANKELGLCSSGVIHASKNINDCFINAKIPCSAYIVDGDPIECDNQKCGFVELSIIEELTNLDKAFGWRYSEAVNPVNPLKINAVLENKHRKLLKQWSRVRDNIWNSVKNSVKNSAKNSVIDSVKNSVIDSVKNSVIDIVWDSVRNNVSNSVIDSVKNSVRNNVWNSVWDSVRNNVSDSVMDSVRNSVWNSVWNSDRDSIRNSVSDSIWAYIGYIFSPVIKKWAYIDHKEGIYPFQCCVDLWKAGFVSSYDGKAWRLHTGEKADIVFEY